ncbi:ABC transporter permease [Paenibacillus sp. MMS18-CY102]|uniref:ABC transporter permease n=1 Tax=Paenibacillus sp. MMS18-CY102 TaxID=2682849 RepID=UPI00136592CA|nr:ABC-2 family transporter protein [Paenibacillus sp. MMS18-CY102]MWC27597.1 hypothetical protein [Paenibacillus sp. MMS18-CY102]
MGVYWRFAKTQVKLDAAYSLLYWSGFLTSLMKLFVIYFFWRAIFEYQPTISGMSFTETLTYMIIATVIVNYVFGGSSDLASMIREGSIAIELMRPYHTLLKIISLDIGSKISLLVRETLPMLVVGYLFLQIDYPPSIAHMLIFLVSLLLGFFIGKEFELLIGLASFWTINDWGMRLLRGAVVLFFSGALMPVNLYPPWLKSINAYLPFQSMVFTPSAIYSGTMEWGQIVVAMTAQVGWLVILFFLVRLIYKTALKKVVIFGG